MRSSRRLKRIPPYLFAELERKVSAKRAEGIDVISLGIGDPDRPTFEPIVAAAQRAVADPSTHHYPTNRGRREFREGRELRRGNRELHEDRGMSTRTSLRERGEISEGANIRTGSSRRSGTTGRGNGESFNANAQRNVRSQSHFNAGGGSSGGVNGNPNPKASTQGNGELSAGGQAGGNRRRGM